MAVLRGVYTAWFALWASSYLWFYGPRIFLWLCCLANVAVLVGLWARRPEPFISAAAVAVLGAHLVYVADFAARLSLGDKHEGPTRYLFDPTYPLYIRGLSLFHVWMPLLLLILMRRFGYERRVLFPFLLFASVLFPVSWFAADPAHLTNDRDAPQVAGVSFDRDYNINRVHGLLDRPDTRGPITSVTSAWACYLVLLVAPVHLALRKLMPEARSIHGL